MAEKQVKRYSKSSVIKERQIKITVTCYFVHIRMAELKMTDNSTVWKACGATRTLMHCCLEDKIHNHSEILYTVPYKVKYTSTQRRIKLEELHHTISRLTRTL